MVSLMKDLELKETIPVKMIQDNLSAIVIIENERSFNRSKHMIARQGFVKQYIDQGDIIFVHCPGEMMPADMLTKPLE